MLSKFKNPSLAMIIFTLFLVTSIFAGTPNTDLAKKLAMADLNHQFLQTVQDKVEQLAVSMEFKQRIVDYSPEKKIGAFLKAIEEAKSKGIDTGRLLKGQTEKTKAFSSGISGTIELANAEVFAFGSHGFFAGYTKADATGKFRISGLSAGEYFLYAKSESYYAYNPTEASVTATQFPDELNLSMSELQAIEINSGTTQDEGAIISGMVTDAADSLLTFAFVFAYNTEDTSFANLIITVLGSYELADLAPGSYILYADSYFEFSLALFGTALPLNARLGQYYEGAATPAEATVLTVAANEELTDRNFVLEMGGAISGTVTDEAGVAVDSIFVIALKDIDLNLDSFSGYFLENIDLAVTVADANGNYVAPGLRTGKYIVGTLSLLNSNFDELLGDEAIFLGKHAGRVLDEFYDGVQNIFDIGDATRVSVTESSTTENIDFDLELAGSISGNFTDASASGPALGNGTVIVFDEESGLPQLAFTTFDSATGAYSAQPLRTGSYKVLGIVAPADGVLGDFGVGKPFYEKNLINLAQQQEDILYLPQFYDGKATYDAADAVAVTQPSATAGINFNMLRAATIAGTVNLPAGGTFPDTLEITVIAFDNQTGELAGLSGISAGESFKLSLPAGTYKVAAVSPVPGASISYAGGGTSFDDENSMQTTVTFGQTVDLSITLTPEFGAISGTVVSDDDGEPLPGVLILAYDGTGHAVSGGVTGFDFLTGSPLTNPGAYSINGLADGNYFVRTFSLLQFLSLLDEDLGGDEEADPLTLIFGLLGSGDNPLSDISLNIYEDAWYSGESIAFEFGDTDIVSLLASLLLSEADPAILQPFFSTPTPGAITVAVNSSGETGDINFRLAATDLNNLTSVEQSEGQLPTNIALAQNYPNPFNPTTVIGYKVPETSQVSLQIYNVLGQKIKTLFKGVKSAGDYNLQWNGLNDQGQQVAAGIYVVRLENGNAVLLRKMLLIK